MPPRRVTVITGASLLLVAGAACGGSEDPNTQPAPAVTTFEQGDFGDLPLPADSEPVGERTESRGVVARSYAVGSATPEQVLDFYSAELGDAVVVEPPDELGVNTVRGTWLVDDRELSVSATEAGELSPIGAELDLAEPVVQFSLTLEPPA